MATEPVQVSTVARMLVWCGSDANQTLLTQIIAGVSGQVARYLNRPLGVTSFARTFDVAEGQRLFSVYESPIATMTKVELLTPGLPDETYEFDAEEYAVNDHLLQMLVEVTAGVARLKATGTGGLAASTAAFATAYPEVVLHAERYIHLLYRRSKAPDIASTSTAGNTTTYLSTDLPREFKDVLDPLRRM